MRLSGTGRPPPADWCAPSVAAPLFSHSPYQQIMGTRRIVNRDDGDDNQEAGQRLEKSGDDGINGLIDKDPLGLERVFIQARRYKPDNTISSDAIREFVGALSFRQASKGIFVTTSSFSNSAKSTAETVNHRIVLIDVQRLSHLMIAHNIGCTPQQTRLIKQFDRDYFDVD